MFTTFATVMIADGSGILVTLLGYGQTFFAAIIVLGVLIFVHEFGHFIVAKKLGVGVEKFSLGFGPKLFGKQIGDTEYLLSAIPLGGYVKLTGEDPEDECENKEHSFTEASVWRRLAIVSAGPVFNILFAVLIFTIVFMVGVPALSSVIENVIEGSPAMKAGLQAGDKILSIDGKKVRLRSEVSEIVHNSLDKELLFKVDRNDQILTFYVNTESRKSKNLFGEEITIAFVGINYIPSIVGKVRDNSPAMKAKLQGGDKILAIDGKRISLWDDLREIVHNSPDKELTFKIDRNGQQFKVNITPESHQTKNSLGQKVKIGLIGIEPTFNNPESNFVKGRYNPVIAVYKGFQETWRITYLTVVAIKKLFQRVIPADTIGGPIMILQTAGEQAKIGILNLVFFVALLSINLGILNLLPIPILDGGHILFFLIEIVIGKPVSGKKREIAQQVGMALLLLLMAFAFYNDIDRIFRK